MLEEVRMDAGMSEISIKVLEGSEAGAMKTFFKRETDPLAYRAAEGITQFLKKP